MLGAGPFLFHEESRHFIILRTICVHRHFRILRTICVHKHFRILRVICVHAGYTTTLAIEKHACCADRTRIISHNPPFQARLLHRADKGNPASKTVAMLVQSWRPVCSTSACTAMSRLPSRSENSLHDDVKSCANFLLRITLWARDSQTQAQLSATQERNSRAVGKLEESLTGECISACLRLTVYSTPQYGANYTVRDNGNRGRGGGERGGFVPWHLSAAKPRTRRKKKRVLANNNTRYRTCL